MYFSSKSKAMPFLLIPCCFLLFGCASVTPVAINENTVYSPPLHMTISKPANWSFVSLHDVRDAQKHVDSTNQTFNYIVYQSAAVPFVTIERNHGDPATIEFYREPLGESRFASSEKVAGFEMWSYLNVITGARVVGPVFTIKIGGLPYAHGRIRYPYNSRDGEHYDLEREFWVRATGISAVVISAVYEVNAGDRVRDDIEQILRSVAIDSPKSS